MIGRRHERSILDSLASSDKAELVAITGRRRVGKTFLIQHHYKGYLVFSFTGTQYAQKANQLAKFGEKLNEYNKKNVQISTPSDWAEAFLQLRKYLQGLRKTKRKKVIFFDEFPWIATHRSGFLSEFGYWWNDWASQQSITVVICGSATSWMIEKVVNNKGGLHNRITQRIHLQPFTLAEMRSFVRAINPAMDHYQIIQLYMSIGGIPHYLDHLIRGESATQALNRLCFQKDGILRTEFENLYAALYDGPERHVEVVRALSSKWKGLTRPEIIALTSFSDGGGLSQILGELETSSFITEIRPLGKKKKDTLYRLTDEYSLFYLKFIEGKRAGRRDIWLQQSNAHDYDIWRGYAFENLCIKHAEAIKIALGIAGVNTQISGFRASPKDGRQGIQIDMLIDRADRCINLCEMKFYNDEWTLNKEDALKLRRRRSIFQEVSKTKKSMYNTVVTTYGVTHNEHSLGQVDHCVTMDQLFLLDHFK